MPELPEVETVRRGLEKLIPGATITGVDVYWEKIISPEGSVSQFQQILIGETLQAMERRGKYLIFRFQKVAMISHLRMEGKYLVTTAEEPLNKHTHVVFRLSDGRQLRYQDVRKFGRMTLVAVEDLAKAIDQLKIGPEPTETEFGLRVFQQQLQSKYQAIKPLLLSQKVVAGVGNIYADEILFRAGILPTRFSDELGTQEVRLLHQQIIAVLAEAVEAGGSTIRSYRNSLGEPGYFQQFLYVYGRKGEPCRKCGRTIEKIQFAQRGTHFCPNCQK